MENFVNDALIKVDVDYKLHLNNHTDGNILASGTSRDSSRNILVSESSNLCGVISRLSSDDAKSKITHENEVKHVQSENILTPEFVVARSNANTHNKNIIPT